MSELEAAIAADPAVLPPSRPAYGTRTEESSEGEDDALIDDLVTARMAVGIDGPAQPHDVRGEKEGAAASRHLPLPVAALEPTDPCGICLDSVRTSPDTTRCGHTFCRGCLQLLYQHLAPDERRPNCPLCRRELPARLRDDDVTNCPSVLFEACGKEIIAAFLLGRANLPNHVEANDPAQLQLR